ncbi:DUF998 domain-containing protein [Streptomyces sp. NBC_01795]|uniref:DUF998 domain-containing protein n=1 Tax=Streptomyces sp. NBC_01795 TaxID=2975943 RepID=UPI002DDA442F|nr:DUF998 domain-containing protein [Streptomyces sp. NBC_01795]WSA94510.1 DUF998 domain-containing protein [Streptomyces sp. NBC_01795]
MNSQPSPYAGHRIPGAARIGAAAWIVAAVQFFAVQLAVQSGWRTPYSWATFNISDLGNVHCGKWDASRPRYVCSPLHDAMNVSFAVHGVLLLAGALLIGGCWGRGGAAVAARVLFVLNCGGWVLVGLVPADVNENLHVLGALFIMGLGNIGLVCAGFLRRDSLFGDGRLRLVTLAIAAVAQLATWLFFAQADPGIGLGGMERLAAFALDAWVLVMAVAVFRAEKPVEKPVEKPAEKPAGRAHGAPGRSGTWV